MSVTCKNCGSPGADPYDLQLRSENPTEVHLCGECCTALKRALAAD